MATPNFLLLYLKAERIVSKISR